MIQQKWYSSAQDRNKWHTLYNQKMKLHVKIDDRLTMKSEKRRLNEQLGLADQTPALHNISSVRNATAPLDAQVTSSGTSCM